MKALRACLFLLLVSSLARAAELATLSGKKLSGDIVSVDGKNVVIKVGESEQSFPINDVVVVDLGNTPKEFEKVRLVAVELTDGTLLNCADFEIKGKTATLVLANPDGKKGRSVEVPSGRLFTILRDAQEARTRLDFQTIVNRRGKRDLMVRKQGNVLDTVEGTFGDGDDSGRTIGFEFASNGAKGAVVQDALQGLVFNQLPTSEQTPTVCKVTDVHKNVLYAKAVAVHGQGLSVTTVSGLKVEYASLAEISKLDFSSAVLRYLSDVDPKAEYDVGLFGEKHYGKDRNLDSPVTGDRNVEKIRLDGVSYAKGLSLHATTSLTYDIGGEYRTFRAVVGADDIANADSAAQVKIEGDGRELWKGLVKSRDKPREVSVNVRSVKQLRIVVSAEEGRTELFHQATLADAKVTK